MNASINPIDFEDMDITLNTSQSGIAELELRCLDEIIKSQERIPDDEEILSEFPLNYRTFDTFPPSHDSADGR